MPLITVVIPVFNSQKYIASAIDSVLAQTFKNFEVLVVDGGSTDKTLAIVNNFAAADTRVKLINNIDDKGPAHARSVGVANSAGNFIAFIDADDLWVPNKLELQIDLMQSNNIDICYSEYYPMNEAGTLVGCPLHIYSSYSYLFSLCTRGIGSPTVVVRRNIFTEAILETYGKSHGEETLWWLLMLKDGATSSGIKIPLAFYRNTPNSLSKRHFNHQLTVWHSYRNELGLGVFAATISYILYVFDVLIRRLKNNICTKIHGYRSVAEVLS